jgi:hypothetical protein
MLPIPKTRSSMTDEGVLVAVTTEPKPSIFARFKKQNKDKPPKKEKKPKEKKEKKPKEKKEKKPKEKKEKQAKRSNVVDEDSVKSASPSPLMSIFQAKEKKKPRSEYQSEIDQLTDELKQTKQLLAEAQQKNSLVQEKLDRLKRWAASPPAV